MRSMTGQERAILERLLDEPFPGRDQLRLQLAGAQVRQLDEDGSLEIIVAGDAPLADVITRVPVEADAADVDGITIRVLLHVLGGRLNELELYKESLGHVTRLPAADTLQVWIATA